MGFGAKVDSELAVGSLDDFFLAGAGFYNDLVFHIWLIITRNTLSRTVSLGERP